MTPTDDLNTMLQQLSEENMQKVRDYVAFSQWREQQAPLRHVWKFDFVEHFAEAERGAERDAAGIEIKAADATCGGETRTLSSSCVSMIVRISAPTPLP